MKRHRPSSCRLWSLVLAIAAAAAAAAPASAFSMVTASTTGLRAAAPLPPRGRRVPKRSRRGAGATGVGSDSLSEYSDGEISDMERLIQSLSSVTVDDARRRQVVALFDEKLSARLSVDSEGDRAFSRETERFCYLFDKVLIQVGEEVQRKAALQAGRRSDSDSPGTEQPGSADTSLRKSNWELQLWALVDMMVQSKTIVKRAKGELGKDGAFG